MILYSKFSNDRRPELSIRTDILGDENGKRSVRKMAAGPEAVPHIQHIAEACRKLNGLFETTFFRANQGFLSGNAIILEYLEGPTLEQEMDSLLSDYPSFLRKMTEYVGAVKTLSDTMFIKSEEFRSIFGDEDFPSDTPCVSAADIDMLLNNIIVGEKWQIIDYEWTFFFPVPTDFLIWRILHYYINTSGKRVFLKNKDLFGLYGITAEECTVYERMERNFQAYVDGSHVALRNLYPEISPGLIRYGEGFSLYKESVKAFSVTFRAGYQDGRSAAAERLVSDAGGRIIISMETRGASWIDIYVEEIPMILHLNALTADGQAWPLERLSHKAILVNNEEFILTTNNHHFRIEGLHDTTRNIVFDVTGEPMDPGMLMSWERMAAQIAAEHRHFLGSEHNLVTKLQEARERIRRDEDLLEMRSNAAIELGQTKMIKAYRKLRMKAGKSDPLAYIRPHIDPEQAEICYSIDSVSYNRHYMTIEGWIYDHIYDRTNLRLISEDGNILKCQIRRFARPDAQAALAFRESENIGFEIIVFYEDMGRLPLKLDVEDPRGFFTIDIPADSALIEKGKKGTLDSWRDQGIPRTYNDIAEAALPGPEVYEQQKKHRFDYEPVISICIPIYKTPLHFLKEVCDSILGQTYEKLELCLADGSPDTACEDFLKANYGSDSRLIYKRLSENRGISENTNEAIAMASGDFIMLCDHDDIVDRRALYEIVRALNENAETDIVYTDEDKITADGRILMHPNFKPDFNWEFLRSGNYICHLFCVRRSLVKTVGGERSEYDGAQDYDFILRCCEKARRIAHVPIVLYHWRSHAMSTSENPENKGYAYINGVRALDAHYKRMGIPAEVSREDVYGYYRTELQLTSQPMVSVIIPNKDQPEMLKRTVESVLTQTDYPNYEILIVENGSSDPQVFELYKDLTMRFHNVRILKWEKEFNYSAINNYAVKEAEGEYILLLNNDMEVVTPSWMRQLLAYAMLPSVGAVGAKLLYPDGRIQHAGIVIGMGGVAGHVFYGMPKDAWNYQNRMNVVQNLSAVTGACLMTAKAYYEEVGGMDEDLAVSYNDVDYCLRLGEKGLRVVMDPLVILTHYESVSRGSDKKSDNGAHHDRLVREAAVFRERWHEILEKGDPCYNPNLALDRPEMALRGAVDEEVRPENF